MSDHGYTRGCACQDCVMSRRMMVYKTHPVIIKTAKEVQNGPVPPEYALVYRYDEREILAAKTAVNEAEIAILEDCAQRGV